VIGKKSEKRTFVATEGLGGEATGMARGRGESNKPRRKLGPKGEVDHNRKVPEGG